MYKHLSLPEKNALIKRILSGEKITHISKEVGISRTIIYKWIAEYKSTGSRGKSTILQTHIKKGKAQWKSFDSKTEHTIIKASLKNPALSSQKLATQLGLSSNGVWRVLKRNNLNSIDARNAYVARNRTVLIPEWSPEDRLLMIRRFENGEKIAQICRDFHISRTIFYKWLKRYYAMGKNKDALLSVRKKAQDHWKFLPGVEEQVLSIVQSNPELSAQKISHALQVTKGEKVAGHTCVHAILKRLHLSTYKKRLAYAQLHPQDSNELVQPPAVVLPEIPDYSYNSFLSPPAIKDNLSSKKLFLLLSTTGLFSGIFLLVILSAFIQAPGITGKLGTFFGAVSLVFGMFFLVYSIKYYLTIGIVLSFSRKEQNEGNASFFSRLFGFEITIEDVASTSTSNPAKANVASYSLKGGGMIGDLSQIQLERQPFISVHVSTYNEKRVIDRLLTAVTSFDYPNYEVIVADDSTDQTVELIEKWRAHPRIKISHRESREGYKGMALQKALERTDKRVEFVLVFDADFIPYPDSITQFLKYFQATVGSLSREAIEQTPIAAVQGYQWHVLNKSENWITRGVRSEYAGSYVIERSGTEIYQGLKQISGSVYMIRRDVLQHIGWGSSITEDFEFTLRLYEQGFKVVYTPYVQAPAEAVSTIKRLIRQRMRWAEGHSFNVKRMFARLLLGRWESIVIPSPSTSLRVDCVEGSPSSEQLGLREIPRLPLVARNDKGVEKYWVPSPLTLTEKLEFLYLTPYYLQAAFFIIGTFSWFLAEVVFQVRLPFWTEVWGWSLVATNMFALPLMNAIGLFLEESEERDYMGLFSFIALSYIVAPFQAYAAVKGFLEKEEGPWFRTPKTGRITDAFAPNRFYRFVRGILGKSAPQFQLANNYSSFNFNPEHSLRTQFSIQNPYVALATSNNTFQNFSIPKRNIRWLGKFLIVTLLISAMTLNYFAVSVPTAHAFGSDIVYSSNNLTINATETGNVSGTAGNATLTVASTTGFAAGDEVLVIQMTGTGKGQFEEFVIQSVQPTTQVTFTTNKVNSYSNTSAQAQMIKAQVNNTVTVNNAVTISSAAWNGTVGGVFYYVANTFTVNAGGIVDMNGKGFAGGTNGGSGAGDNNIGGTGSNGTAGSTGSGDGGGGGGGGGNGGTSAATGTDSGGAGGGAGGGGAGGSYGTAASNGSAGGTSGPSGRNNAAVTGGTAGTAGTTYGCSDFSSTNGCMFLGSGGAGSGGAGGGGYGDSGLGGAGGAGATGGAGGGIIYIHANTVSNSGTIQANGAVGGNGPAGTGGSAGTTNTGGGGGAGGRGGSAGGGAGGSIWISAPSVTVGTLNGTGGATGTAGAGANGGPCDTGTANDGGGGAGGGSANGTGGSINCTNTVSPNSTGSGTVGSAGGSGRIKCDNSGGNCSGNAGSPAIGNTEVATAPVPEYGIFGLPLLWFIPRLLAMLQMRLRRRLSFWAYLLLKEGRRMSTRRPRSQGKEGG